MADLPAQSSSPSAHLDPKTRDILLQAWMGQRNEWTKAIFTLSSAAIGLIFAGVLGSHSTLSGPVATIAFLGLMSFALAAFSSLSAFQESADLVGAMYAGRSEGVQERRLTWISRAQKWGFSLGLASLVLAPVVHVGLPLVQRCFK